MLNVLHVHQEHRHVVAVQMRLQRFHRLLQQIHVEIRGLGSGVCAAGAYGILRAAHEVVAAADIYNKPDVVVLVELLHHGLALIEGEIR